MALETKTIDLAGGPVDLAADVNIAAALANEPVENGLRLFLQNVSEEDKVYYAERTDEPAQSDRGHCLSTGDGFTLRLFSDRHYWIWAESTGLVAVSPASHAVY